MKKIVFVLGIVICFVCSISDETLATEIPAGGVSGTCNNAGTCLWSLSSDGTMTISAASGATNVKMENYRFVDATWEGNRPWEQNIAQIKNIVVGDNIVNIGKEAFQNAVNLETVTGMKDVKTIGYDCFASTRKLSLIETPNVETLENCVFTGSGLKSIDLPNVKEIGVIAFSGTTRLEYAGIPKDVTYVEDDYSRSAFEESKLSNCQNTGECGSCGEKFVQAGVGCVSSCYDGYYATNQGYCKEIKLRYTLPEADAATSNDNENMIEWIFE